MASKETTMTTQVVERGYRIIQYITATVQRAWRTTKGTDVMEFTFRDPTHTPDNKLSGEVSSTGVMTVRQGPSGSLTVQLEEHTTGKAGRSQSRSISMTMSEAHKNVLLAYLAGDNSQSHSERVN